jgi:phospholipid/cholesterol/gamma-HCH transport system permease protein
VFTFKVDPGNLLDQMARMGMNSLVIVSVINMFTGAIISLQGTRLVADYGATQLVGLGVALTMVRELGPVLTGVVMAGRVGSAMASEIGTMVVSEQVDALRALSINPLRFLVTPRMLACMSMVPLLALVSCVLAILTGYWVAHELVDLHWKIYMGSIQKGLEFYDIYVGLLKSVIFGITVAAVGCFKGLNTTGGARGVGEATTGSVVLSIVLVFLENLISTYVFF